jgi:hypothetical protein
MGCEAVYSGTKYTDFGEGIGHPLPLYNDMRSFIIEAGSSEILIHFYPTIQGHTSEAIIYSHCHAKSLISLSDTSLKAYFWTSEFSLTRLNDQMYAYFKYSDTSANE